MTMKNLNSVLDSKNMKLLQETEEEEDEEEYIVSSMTRHTQVNFGIH